MVVEESLLPPHVDEEVARRAVARLAGPGLGFSGLVEGLPPVPPDH